MSFTFHSNEEVTCNDCKYRFIGEEIPSAVILCYEDIKVSRTLDYFWKETEEFCSKCGCVTMSWRELSEKDYFQEMENDAYVGREWCPPEDELKEN